MLENPEEEVIVSEKVEADQGPEEEKTVYQQVKNTREGAGNAAFGNVDGMLAVECLDGDDDDEDIPEDEDEYAEEDGDWSCMTGG